MIEYLQILTTFLVSRPLNGKQYKRHSRFVKTEIKIIPNTFLLVGYWLRPGFWFHLFPTNDFYIVVFCLWFCSYNSYSFPIAGATLEKPLSVCLFVYVIRTSSKGVWAFPKPLLRSDLRFHMSCDVGLGYPTVGFQTGTKDFD